MGELASMAVACALGAAWALAANQQVLLVSRLTLFFCAVSVCGWAWETAFCAAREHRLERRGFLFGPLCPIYGAGAVGVRVLLGWSSDPVLVFFAGALLATAIEWVTGALLWARYGRTWWDYSMFPLNVRGRICAGASAVFGAFSVLCVFVLAPAFDEAVATLRPQVTVAFAFLWAVAVAADLAASAVWNDAARRARVIELARRIAGRP